MDIEEIKKRVVKDHEDTWSLAQGMLWVIEQLEQAERVQVARLEPGDVVVLETTGPITQEDFGDMRRRMDEAFPNNKTLILMNDTTLSVVHPEAVTA